MIDLYDFLLTAEEFKAKSKSISDKGLYLKIDFSRVKTEHYFGENELEEWLRMFNNNLGKLNTAYIFMNSYYDKGIPDKRWYDFSNGKMIFFPDFKDEHFAYKFWFGFYVDVVYYYFFIAWDLIMHLINIYYNFKIKPNNQFNKNVKNKLSAKNNNLYKCLINQENDKHFVDAKVIRNDISHNYSKRYIGSLYKRSEENRNGVQGETVKIGGLPKYITTKQLKENIYSIFEILRKIITVLKTEFETL